MEQTLSIIKPNAVEKNVIGEIYSKFEQNGLKIIASKMIHLSTKQAHDFYSVHEGKPFFDFLVKFMTSSPVMVQVLEGENAISKNREIMGATNPDDAKEGTIRALFADSMPKNAVHGSDSLQTASEEIKFFFKENEVFSS